MSRTRHYRDLQAWQKAMDLARTVYAHTEDFPNSETFGLKMQLRRSALAVATHIADGHGRQTDAEFKKCLGMARGSLNEFTTQTELAADLKFINEQSSKMFQDLATSAAKLINALLGVLD